MSCVKLLNIILLFIGLAGCGNKEAQKVESNLSMASSQESVAPGDVETSADLGIFNVDSAYNYLAKQVAFGPRVPNTEAHIKAGDWLSSELRRHGAEVIEQKMVLKAFDGTNLNSRNIFAQFRPESKERILLLAHWDCRPWADNDPDPSKRNIPVDGANDGASGVAILLETARQLSLTPIEKGVDILFVDAEDWGTEGDDRSWALGTRHFVENPPINAYSPQFAILLDMVGGEGAMFCREYFSERSAPQIAEEIWQTAHKLGYAEMFPDKMGSAIMDDHVELIKGGIPAIDIIEYHPGAELGFNPRWHTTSDNMEGISKETLKAVGSTIMAFLKK